MTDITVTKLKPSISVKPVHLEPARAALAQIETQVIELKDRRKSRLLAGDDARAIAEIDKQIALADHARRTEADRIELLEAEARKQEAEAAERRRVAHIAKFSKLLDEADAIAAELQACVTLADQLFRKLIARREAAAAMFDVTSSHARAAAGNHEGCALSSGAVAALLKFELFRIGARPSLGGVPGQTVEQSFPGGLSPDITRMLDPGKVVPFVDTLRKASAFAINLLQAELGPSAAASVATGEQPPRTAAQERLAQLLKQQSEAAKDTSPDGERKYSALVAEIAKAQAEAEGAQ